MQSGPAIGKTFNLSQTLYVTSKLPGGQLVIAVFQYFFFSRNSQILNHAIVIFNQAIKRTDSKRAKWRRIRIRPDNFLARMDNIGNFETITFAVARAQRFVRSNIKRKNTFGVVPYPASHREDN